MSVHICTGTNKRYLARARHFGFQKYTLIGKPTKSYKVAVKRMATAFVDKGYKRADVLFLEDWYDPIVMCELVNK